MREQMTPGVRLAKKAGIAFNSHEYKHDPKAASYGLEAVEKLNIAEDQVFKTLVVETVDNRLVATIIPVAGTLNLKKGAGACGSKKIAMADKNRVQKTTGYVLGGVSPLGQKKLLPTFIDSSALTFDTIYVSGGKRGLEIELAPKDLADLLGASLIELCD